MRKRKVKVTTSKAVAAAMVLMAAAASQAAGQTRLSGESPNRDKTGTTPAHKNADMSQGLFLSGLTNAGSFATERAGFEPAVPV